MSCKVAFIGLGVMGYPMAGYISKAGHNVTVFNRTTSKADKWLKNIKVLKLTHQQKHLRMQILFLHAWVMTMI
jgi:3-hydroxyisobutyrate dehydrogenase and related beta-hydroxyacid dehydrogenases